MINVISVEKKEVTAVLEYEITHLHGSLRGSCEISKHLVENHEHQLEKLIKNLIMLEVTDELNEVE